MQPVAAPLCPPGLAANRPALLMLGLVLVALNLRPALSSVSPVLAQVQQALGLSATAAGLLTTLPVLCLGVFAPLAPRLAQRLDAERAVFAVLFVLAAGTALRGAFGSVGLFAGALLAGASIGVIGVLLPGIVKREFAGQAGAVMGLYTMSLSLGAALAAGATVPLSRVFDGDWRPALALWALPALLGAAAWWPQLRQRTRQAPAAPASGLWRSPLAWAVTLYMGLQSSLAYCVFGWLPTILIERGISALQAGFVLSLAVLLQLVTAFSGPWLATRIGRDQRPVLWLMLGTALAGLLGCLWAPLGSLWLWAALLGLGQGGQFSVALLLVVLRAPNPQRAAQLSGMAQGVGYTLAAFGPLAVGLLHDATGGWGAVGVLFMAFTVAAAAAGGWAGQHKQVPA
ncbi:MAG TPA: CynX/NimT family MFS transporter [Burkholderiaceae bacterium]|nr:CynX/NimT family MFS transporter [Burkholderiaceae bacterium]